MASPSAVLENTNHNRLLQALSKLPAGRMLLGLCNMYPSAGLVEGMCPGWDFVWIDGQHGQMAYDAMLHAIYAAEVAGVATVLRVPGHESSWLGLAADLDVDALMVPMVNTAEEAAEVARRTHFPPLGVRSYGGRRVIDRRGRDYYRQHRPLVMAQIETVEAVGHASAIIAVEGIDMLFFGPDDMKVSMGLPIDTNPVEHPQLRQAMERVASAARTAGKFAGCVAASPSNVQAAAEMGYHLAVGGGDIAFLRVAAAQRLAELRAAMAGAAEDKGTETRGVY